MTSETASMAHIITQTQANISFLETQGYLGPAEAANIRAQLATASASNGNTFRTPGFAVPGARPVPAPPKPSAPETAKAKAIWGYNEDESNPKDLSFSVGETIEIVEENNADWWTGRARGKQGLFPSNYVEKLPQQATYKPFMAAHHGADLPPAADTTEKNSIGLQQDPGQDQKKSKFGKYGNTMAQSAAGGVGFGAGAAVGGGLVRAIF